MKNLKQIIFNENKGKYFLAGDSDEDRPCDIYGENVTRFLPGISGKASFSFREKKGRIKQQNTKTSRSLYRPQNTKFEGYCQFPSPLSPPLFNVSNHKEKEKLKQNISNNRNFRYEKNNSIFDKPVNVGVDYFTSSLSKKDYSNKQKVIQSIDKYVCDYKEKNKRRQYLVEKNRDLISLAKLRKKLLENMSNSLVNGRQVPSPSKIVNEKYIFNKKLIKKSREVTSELQLKKLNKSQNDFKENSIFKNDPDPRTYDILDAEEDRQKILKKAELDKQCEKEKKFINGFKEPEIPPEKLILKGKPKGLKTAGELYKQDIELLMKVNPVAFEQERKKNAYEQKVFEKKKADKLINQKNLGF